MKRRLLIIGICLLLGAVVNVAVAWGLAWWPRSAVIIYSQDQKVLPSSRDVEWWNIHVFPLFDVDIEDRWDCRDLGVEMRVFYATDSNQRTVCVIHVLSGWPARSMSGETWDAVMLGGQLPKWSNRRAMFAGRGFIPFRPIWPGFALNTIFYAAILWLLIPGPFALRRFLRVRRGLCPKCAYPMGDSSVCTECGRDLPKRAVAWHIATGARSWGAAEKLCTARQ